MKMLKLNLRIIKSMKNFRIQTDNPENHKNPKVPRESQEHHENLRIPSDKCSSITKLLKS